jgi:rhodanese-related sulfurtransferase
MMKIREIRFSSNEDCFGESPRIKKESVPSGVLLAGMETFPTGWGERTRAGIPGISLRKGDGCGGDEIMARSEGTLKSTFLPALAALVLFVALIGTAWAGVDTARNVGPGEAQALIRGNAGNRDFVVLDVRTPGEFAEGHIEGAVLVDYLSPGFRQEMAGLDKTKTYLVYCRTGNRSTSALGIMRELGFRSYYHLEGGITRWLEEGMPAVR